ncbi:hypothetical protein EVAR_75866_1 [Eumeta japonica]|uniref:Uncharacterized protein n=1 Tax=Eumeta variegata TaxID=151549 RepID=A0A4C1TGB5_EUMVA|nr:hypothetical protein EVAR_75866_1 [Eumeta japonica]
MTQRAMREELGRAARAAGARHVAPPPAPMPTASLISLASRICALYRDATKEWAVWEHPCIPGVPADERV